MKEFNFGSVAMRRDSEASPLWSIFKERPELVADRGPQASALVAYDGRQRALGGPAPIWTILKFDVF